MKPIQITPSEINSLRTRYSYDPESGELTCHARTGKGPGNTRGAYLVKSNFVRLSDGRNIAVGRVIHAIMTGADVNDKEIVRHIDGNLRNRKWSNLQVSTWCAIPKETWVKNALIPHLDFLRECFTYDGETGYLLWRERPATHFKTIAAWRTFNTRRAGKRAGTAQSRDGRLQVHMISGDIELHAYTTSIIWALVYGEEVPQGCVIDHIDGKKRETLDNLRIATYAGNSQNSKRSKTTPGMQGIFKLTNGKYSVRFVNNPRNYQFSRCFVNLEDARMCRKALEFRYQGSFAYEPTQWTPELQTWLDRLESLNRANTRPCRIKNISSKMSKMASSHSISCM